MSIYIEKYSELSFAVFGDTRSVKDELKSMEGKYNPKLGESQKPGWIFSNKHKQAVEEFISKKPSKKVEIQTNTNVDDIKPLLSSLINRIEVLETELALLKVGNHRIDTTQTPTRVQKKVEKKVVEEFSSEEEEEEQHQSLLFAFKKNKK